MENKTLLVLKMINLALNEIGTGGSLPPGADDFVELVTQYGGRGSMTREEVEAVLNRPLKELVDACIAGTSS
ncbi:hypothetical protein [Aeromonas sp. MrichA-1]|uniref:hypothetical protein n=1 Tax=Aeromonas sp. MrichA-1 TaxID=2823362 RepID=UPI001B331A14|nr:hypothetical protein [Aeromonas sp. MrichA-1]MBP4081896.1 hypothetical protein [Aeromonas sp. MrichA-1]